MPAPIAILIFAAWFAFAWLKPAKAFSFLPFALPFYLVRLSIGPLPTTALEMIVLATIMGTIFSFGTKQSNNQTIKQSNRIVRLFDCLIANSSFRPWRYPLLAWLIAGVISVVAAPDHLAALGLYRAYFVEPILLFFVGICLRNSKFEILNSLKRNLFLLTILFGLWAIFQYLTGIGLPAEYAPVAIRRAVGPFPYPNALALFVVPITALALADRIAAFGRVKRDSIWHLAFGQNEPPNAKRQTPNAIPSWLGWTAIAAGITATILAKSDGGLIALIAAAFVALLMNKRTRIFAIIAAAVGVIAIFAVPQIKTPVMNQILFKEWSGKVRVIMWKETVSMLKDRPILGAGLSAYPAAIAPYHKATWMEVFQYPHNILLNLWSETGTLGVVAFGWMLVTWVRMSVRPYVRRTDSVIRTYGHTDLRTSLPVITAILVHGLVDVPYFKNDLAILFFLLILVTGVQNSEPDSDKILNSKF
jgi:O-antigen ligase